jgi:hypothetical protein
VLLHVAAVDRKREGSASRRRGGGGGEKKVGDTGSFPQTRTEFPLSERWSGGETRPEGYTRWRWAARHGLVAACGGDNFLGSEQFRTFSTSKSTNTNKQPPSSRKNELSFE